VRRSTPAHTDVSVLFPDNKGTKDFAVENRQLAVCLCILVSECGFGLNYKESCMKKLVLEAAATSFQWQKKGGW
jgi:hypothetical protein